MVIHCDIEIATTGRGTTEITHHVREFVTENSIDDGLCNIFLTHTSASLMLCENADPAVRTDLETFMGDLIRDGDPRFVHVAEGADDMPAHVRSVLTQSSITLPVRGGRLTLGTWQGLYLWEHRTQAHRRRLILSLYS